eukprot:8648782-Pyramimonas_sp.AAC.1
MEIRQKRKGRNGAHYQVAPGTSGLHGPRSLRPRSALRNGAAAKPAIARQRGGAQQAVDHCFPRRQRGLLEGARASRARCSDR